VEGPVIKTVPLTSDEGLRHATLAVISRPPDILVATTGIGMRGLFAAAQAWDLEGPLLAAFRSGRIAARGPKAAGAIRQAGLDVWWQEPSERLDGMLEHITAEISPGTRVALQCYGNPVPWAVGALEAAGAEVVELSIYEWTLPDDPAPAYRLIEAACELRVDAVTLTTSPAVGNLLRLAADLGAVDSLRESLNTEVEVVCVGPVCGSAAKAHGLHTAVWPEHGRLGLMVKVATDRLEGRRQQLATDAASDVVVQGSALVHSDGIVRLSDKERALLRILTRRPGAVVSRAALGREAWDDERADSHLIDVAIGRLRRHLAPTGLRLVSVPRRGYRLDGVTNSTVTET
jgi:uroporphyrinogen-III synthase